MPDTKIILSQVKNQVDPHIARKEFLGMTRDVSLWLWLFLKNLKLKEIL